MSTERNDLAEIEQRLWAAAVELRANSKLTLAEYRDPVLGLIFLAYAEHRFLAVKPEVEAKASERRPAQADDYRARGVVFVPEISRLSWLASRPEGEDVGSQVDLAMDAIEAINTDLEDVLPRGYAKLEKSTLIELIRLFAPLPQKLSGDAFGLIYEYFLTNFAASEGKLGGEFFTPQSIVRLIVEIIEPFHGKVYDPACGSGGMFVQSARFVDCHQGSPARDLSVYGLEQKEATVPIGLMNLALHGLSGNIRLANSYYEDPHDAVGTFDFVMANPPFNVEGIDKAKLAGDARRFPFGLPSADNGNYIWIQLFRSALNNQGRAGFVMANSASDARYSEADIRRRLIEERSVDVMISVGSNFFYTVPLPVTLWFLDAQKHESARKDTILFIDARKIYEKVDRTHRDFSPEQLALLSNTVRLYRGQTLSLGEKSELTAVCFPTGTYTDVVDFCRAVPVTEVAQKDWSLNPLRYVERAAPDEANNVDFHTTLSELYLSYVAHSDEAEVLRACVEASIRGILEA